MTHYAHMIAYLQQHYAHALFQRDTITYPAIVHPAPPQARLDDVLGRLDTSIMGIDDFAFYDYAYLHTLQNQHPRLYNGMTFVLDRLHTRPLKLDVRLGRYFDMLATCASLQHELENASQRRFIRLPARAQLHRTLDAQQAITRGAGRSATIGVAILVVFNHQGTYKAIMARRGADNATDSGRYHLLPAFIFQPQTPDVQPEEWSIVHQVWREYLEELFGMEEGQAVWHDHPAYVDIQARIATGSASLHLTGIVTNVITLRPEVTGLLLIRDATWYERITAPDSPTPLNAHAEAQAGALHLVHIETDDELRRTLPPHLHEVMPAQGAVAFWLGVDRARQLLGQA